MADIITAKNLCLWYGDTQALKSINIAVPEHSITALIGPSGCGKSTFLKTLNRMNDLIPGVRITGDVRYEGKDIFQAEVNNLRKEVGMVFQKPNPFPMSIYDNIAYGPRTHGIHNKAKLDEIVERSLRDAAIWDEVKDRLKKNALGLSGGQQQRLCIARALAVEPKVLLMDEPTSALDPISTLKIEELAASLKKDYTIVIVTHNMRDAALLQSHERLRYLEGGIRRNGTDFLSASGQTDRRLHHGEVRIMRELFEEQLLLLNQELTEMGSLCEEIISLATQALGSYTKELGEKVSKVGAKIDEEERTIETICMRLLLRQQPVARDLRVVSAALKMITDMERIGDQAEDIVEIIPCTIAHPHEEYPKIREMAKETIAMVTDSVDAYVKQDVYLAKAVQMHDDVVDNYFTRIKSGLIDMIAKNPAEGEYALDLLMIAKYFERIGDHATNIAEWVEFSVTGSHNAISS